MMEWQPIETAPRDGCHILLAGIAEPGGVVVAYWNTDVTHQWECSHDDQNDLYGDPTHWMPLPAPPVAPSDERG